MTQIDPYKWKVSASVKSPSLVGRLLCFVLAVVLLPYGTAGASTVQKMIPPDSSSMPSQSSHSAAQVLVRLGMEVSHRDAAFVEEALLEGEDVIEIVKMTLPSAVGLSGDIEQVKLLNQIPLGVRSRLFKELATGAGWDKMSDDILAHIPLALAASLSRETSLKIATSLPISMNDAPYSDLPTPYGESLPTDQALPAVSGSATKLESQKSNRYHQHGVALYGLTPHVAKAKGPARETLLPKSRSIYSRLGLMPTGPPVGDRTPFLPNQNASLASVGRPYGR